MTPIDLKWFGDGYDLVRCNLGYLASLAVGVTENAEEECLVMALSSGEHVKNKYIPYATVA
jgi:hypothetical protein